MHKNKDAEIARLNGIYQGMLERTKVTIYRARVKARPSNEPCVCLSFMSDGCVVVWCYGVMNRPQSWMLTPSQCSRWKATASNRLRSSPLNGIQPSPPPLPSLCPLTSSHRLRNGVGSILVATGSYPFLPSIPGIEHAVTSNALFDWSVLPKSVVIVGGGYIGTEFAGILHGTGLCTGGVTQIVRGDKLLERFDVDLRTELTNEYVCVFGFFFCIFVLWFRSFCFAALCFFVAARRSRKGLTCEHTPKSLASKRTPTTLWQCTPFTRSQAPPPFCRCRRCCSLPVVFRSAKTWVWRRWG
jgi:hypothetical protein